jgi:hypothetical protein
MIVIKTMAKIGRDGENQNSPHSSKVQSNTIQILQQQSTIDRTSLIATETLLRRQQIDNSVFHD